MAPERPPILAVWDLSLRDGLPTGRLSYYEAKEGAKLRVRWGATRKPSGFFSVNDGVVHVLDSGDITRIPGSTDMSPEALGRDRYRWPEGGFLRNEPSIMMVLVLPEGCTLTDPSPTPISAKVWRGRLALYWIPTTNDEGRAEVQWTLTTLADDLASEVQRMNTESARAPTSSPIKVESETSKARPDPLTVPSTPPGSAGLVVLAAIFGGLTLVFMMALVVMATAGYEVPCDSRFLVVAVLAFGAALSSSFLGGSAAAKGAIPIPYVRSHPVQFSLAGGAAVLVVMLLIGYYVYIAKECGGARTVASFKATGPNPPSAASPDQQFVVKLYGRWLDEHRDIVKRYGQPKGFKFISSHEQHFKTGVIQYNVTDGWSVLFYGNTREYRKLQNPGVQLTPGSGRHVNEKLFGELTAGMADRDRGLYRSLVDRRVKSEDFRGIGIIGGIATLYVRERLHGALGEPEENEKLIHDVLHVAGDMFEALVGLPHGLGLPDKESPRSVYVLHGDGRYERHVIWPNR